MFPYVHFFLLIKKLFQKELQFVVVSVLTYVSDMCTIRVYGHIGHGRNLSRNISFLTRRKEEASLQFTLHVITRYRIYHLLHVILLCSCIAVKTFLDVLSFIKSAIVNIERISEYAWHTKIW